MPFSAGPYPVGPGQYCPGLGISGPTGVESCTVPPQQLDQLVIGPAGTIIPAKFLPQQPSQAPQVYAPPMRRSRLWDEIPSQPMESFIPQEAPAPSLPSMQEEATAPEGPAGPPWTQMDIGVDATSSSGAAEAVKQGKMRGDNMVRGLFNG